MWNSCVNTCNTCVNTCNTGVTPVLHGFTHVTLVLTQVYLCKHLFWVCFTHQTLVWACFELKLSMKCLVSSSNKLVLGSNQAQNRCVCDFKTLHFWKSKPGTGMKSQLFSHQFDAKMQLKCFIFGFIFLIKIGWPLRKSTFFIIL